MILSLTVAYRHISECHCIHKIREKVHPACEPKFVKMWEKGAILFAPLLSPCPTAFGILAPLLLILVLQTTTQLRGPDGERVYSRFLSERWKLLAESYGQRQIENLLRDGYSLCFPAFFFALFLWCKNYILLVVYEMEFRKQCFLDSVKY